MPRKLKLVTRSARCKSIEIRGTTAFYPIGSVCQKDNGRWAYTVVSASRSSHGNHKTAALATKAALRTYKTWIG